MNVPSDRWEALALLEADIRMGETNTTPEAIDDIIAAARATLEQSNHTIYHALCGMVLAMKCLGCDQTGMNLEQARFAFRQEGRR